LVVMWNPEANALAPQVAPNQAPAAAAEGQLLAPAQQVWPPTSAAALRQLVRALGIHEPDLKDLLLGLCKPRYCATQKSELQCGTPDAGGRRPPPSGAPRSAAAVRGP